MNNFRHVVFVNKGKNITSREVDLAIKNIYGCKKAGHVGTLDPNATGLLLICLDEATKLVPLLEGSDKEYEGIIYLHKDISIQDLKGEIKKHFVGEIKQTPPVKSRVSRKERRRVVYSFDILKKDGKNIYFRTKVQAGTYIRKLAHDIGQKLKVGAHLKELNRTAVDGISINSSHTLEEIEKNLQQFLVNIEDVFDFAKKVEVKNSSIKKVINGLYLVRDDITHHDKLERSKYVCIKNSDQILALGKVLDDKKVKIKVDRVLSFSR